jgi:hypothetical protein
MTDFIFDSTGSNVIAIAERGRVSLTVIGNTRPAPPVVDLPDDIFAILDDITE